MTTFNGLGAYFSKIYVQDAIPVNVL